MICQKCSSPINSGDSFCGVCGANLAQQIETENSIVTNNSINDETLIDAYIGKNAEKLKNRKFSFCAFFLGPLYFAYRKLWLYGIIYFVINVIISEFSPTLEKFLGITLCILSGIFFNKLYLKEVKKRVEKIKNKNEELPSTKIIEICKTKGKISILQIIIFITCCFIGNYFFSCLLYILS